MDDATSAVVSAVFCISENTAGYFTLLEGLIERWGIPLALANCPQAGNRGRIDPGPQEARSPHADRAAGTFQDRLVTEL